MIDTGAAAVGILRGRVETIEFRGPSNTGGKLTAGPVPQYDDNHGHGTAVSYVICSHAPNAVIHSYCAMPYEQDGSRGGSYVVEALEAVLEAVKADSRRHIVNMSLSCEMSGESAYIQRMHTAIKELVAVDVPVVVAAGNDGRETLTGKYPSCFHEPFCVSAIDNGGDIAGFSTWHNEVDFCDLGVQAEVIDLDGAPATMNGTSFASPMVAAKLALMLGQNPNLTEQELYEAATANARDMEDKGFDPRTGWGFIASADVAETPKAETPKAGTITGRQLAAAFERFEAEGRGYVYGAQGELYTQELAEKWHARAKAGSKSVPSGRDKDNYFIGDCSKWIGCYVDDCSGGVVDAIRQRIPDYADRTANGFKAGFKVGGTINTLPERPGVALWYSGHIGIYIGDGYAIEFRGTDYGCVRTKVSARKWTHWGEIAGVTYTADADDTQEPPAAEPYCGVCTGGSVYVRTGPGTEYSKLGTAHKGDKLLVLPGDGWPQVAVVLDGKLVTGYMSGRYVGTL